MRVMSPLELSAIPYPCVSCPFALALLVVLAYFLSPSVATIVTKIFSYQHHGLGQQWRTWSELTFRVY